MTVVVSAFYKFARVDDCDALAAAIQALCETHGIKGTMLIAHEGINATMSGSADAIETLHAFLRTDPRFTDLTDKHADAVDHPFQRLKVKVKPEIVTFGAEGADPNTHVGTYVEPKDWDALIADPEVTVVDTRNSFECQLGTFPRAIDPGTDKFSDLPRFVAEQLAHDKSKPIAMFCTGGIRCEKATAYLLSEGFTHVFHLKGGILGYLNAMPEDKSTWQGECFVFDERRTVK
jgi:UPF0176 protein